MPSTANNKSSSDQTTEEEEGTVVEAEKEEVGAILHTHTHTVAVPRSDYLNRFQILNNYV